MRLVKWLPGEAAGEFKPEAYPQEWVEDLEKLGTKPEAIFNSRRRELQHV
ncbi:MAG TPA: hypothetical protein VM842_01935 [Nitrospira sp.]|nr:hypothetical protein [Nitrospira sp.]